MKNTKRAGIITASATTLIVGGVAFAAWTTNGTGNGVITAGNDLAMTITNDAAVSGLVPNTTKNIVLKVTNPNPYAVSLSSLSPQGDFTTNKTGCDKGSSAVSFTGLTDPAAKVPADGSQTYTVTVSMGVTSVDACKGAVFTQPYAASGASTD